VPLPQDLFLSARFQSRFEIEILGRDPPLTPTFSCFFFLFSLVFSGVSVLLAQSSLLAFPLTTESAVLSFSLELVGGFTSLVCGGLWHRDIAYRAHVSRHKSSVTGGDPSDASFSSTTSFFGWSRGRIPVIALSSLPNRRRDRCTAVVFSSPSSREPAFRLNSCPFIHFFILRLVVFCVIHWLLACGQDVPSPPGFVDTLPPPFSVRFDWVLPRPPSPRQLEGWRPARVIL